jgi:hypothetical protein
MHWWGQPAWGMKMGMMKGRGVDAKYRILDARCWLLAIGLWLLEL